jgi:hypothetical protein
MTLPRDNEPAAAADAPPEETTPEEEAGELSLA